MIVAQHLQRKEVYAAAADNQRGQGGARQLHDGDEAATGDEGAGLEEAFWSCAC